MTSPFKDDILVGKTAFITGGTSGINFGIARRFVELGAKVAVLGRNPVKTEKAARALGPSSLGFNADVRNYELLRASMEEAARILGRFDVVIAGAAGNFLAPALGMSPNAFKAVVDIDLLGTFNVFRGCHDLTNSPGASLIAISAAQAVNAVTLQAHACAAKAGINHLVRVLAMEWGPDVRVNGISPGPIEDTEGMARLARASREASELRIPLRRWGSAHEIAEAAVYLSTSASSYVSGTILTVDGGSSLGDASRDMP